jgi:hypothetical protein
MYLIAERLRRPMRRQFGGKWISMLGIPPLTFVFMPLMLVTSFIQRKDVKRRERKLAALGNKIDKRWTGSWF